MFKCYGSKARSSFYVFGFVTPSIHSFAQGKLFLIKIFQTISSSLFQRTINFLDNFRIKWWVFVTSKMHIRNSIVYWNSFANLYKIILNLFLETIAPFNGKLMKHMEEQRFILPLIFAAQIDLNYALNTDICLMKLLTINKRFLWIVEPYHWNWNWRTVD